MKRWMFAAGFSVIVAAAAGGGYVLGRDRDEPTSERTILYYRNPMGQPDTSPVPKKDSMGMDYIPVYADEAQAQPAQAPDAKSKGRILYYRNPMGQPDTSPVPKKDSMGMDYIPVYADDAQAPPPQTADAKGKGRILYYRNPMGQPDTSPVPKKDSMGMDYIPVYEAGAGDSGVVNISPERVQQLGVRSDPVEMRRLARTIQSVGTVEANERRLFTVTTKFDGWIETLNVDATGQAVGLGEPLMEIYAPELVAVQQEYLLAYRSLQSLSKAPEEVQNSARELANAALERLRNWDISDDQIQRLLREGTTTRTLTLRSPADGVVLEKTAIAGMHFAAGEPLYRIANLTVVWVIVEVFEQDLSALRQGQDAMITVDAYPGASFNGKIDFIYPTVTQETRTAKVRMVTANQGGRLKPGMYARITLQAPLTATPMLAVAESAVLDSGTRQIVLVDMGEGRFQPRDVKLGSRADGYYAVLDGLKSGENVVVGANFLIDAESNLRAALQTFAPPQTSQAPAQTSQVSPPPAQEGAR